jgi:hypothetical protein
MGSDLELAKLAAILAMANMGFPQLNFHLADGSAAFAAKLAKGLPPRKGTIAAKIVKKRFLQRRIKVLLLQWLLQKSVSSHQSAV